MQTRNSRPSRYRRYFSVPIIHIVPASPPSYLRPTYDNPIIGERPDYFPEIINTLSNGMFAMWYYDDFGRAVLEYGDLTDHRIRNYFRK